MNTFKKVSLVVAALLISIYPVSAVNSISLEDAVKKGLIKLIIKSKGGFTGKVIEMKIKNTSSKNLELALETGRKLDSKKNCEQDILVIKPEAFLVGTNQSATINVFGMCCQAQNSSPSEDSEYVIGQMADSNLIKLAEFIDRNKYYTSATAQQAVWALSDNNSLGSITGDDKPVVDNLRNYVSKITGKTIPPYDISYEREFPNEVLGRANKIEGEFDYELPANAHVTLAIYNEEGQLVQLLFEDYAHQKGNYKLHFVFKTRNLESGTYYARIKMDGETGKEMKIEF